MKSGGLRKVTTPPNNAAARSMRQMGGLPATASVIGLVMELEVGTVAHQEYSSLANHVHTSSQQLEE
jgi:hypothetical protein